MYTKARFPFIPALTWTSEVFPAMVLWSGALTAAHELGGLPWLQIPALPVSILGTAVSFYLGFKGNAAYDRLWEARKIWGGIVNTSRTWGVYVTTMVTRLHRVTDGGPEVDDLRRELVYRHIAWLNALRTQLLRPKSWEHRHPWNDRYRADYGTLDTSAEVLRHRIAPLVPEAELDGIMSRKNQATTLLHRQGERLTELYATQYIEDFRHMELMKLIEEFYTLQGKCERIKNFPLPRQYSTANHWFVKIFITMLPLALLGVFSDEALPAGYIWLTIPVATIIGWVFFLWDRVVDYSENPFEGLINDIPMEALSRTIEIDLREMLGETELPPAITPVNDSVLM